MREVRGAGEANAGREGQANAAREAVLAAGGRPLGEVVTLTNAPGKRLTWVYVTDPEGNVLELQSLPK
ncbi:MAG TPA: hypothetical protein VFK39_00830 [Gemmatimonadaceae bacterium]|nr:hypothetical protein [Gemmatimonadaceae bacterium]